MSRYLILALAGLIGCREDGSGIKQDPKPDSQIINGGDEDGDGYSSDEDCDDLNAEIHPDATELCNGVDNNCDGATDEDLEQTWYQDADGDNYGDLATATADCYAPEGYIGNNTDCDDGDATVFPGANEACTDQVDRDCDGVVPYADVDGDGFAACEDCDDANAAVNPSATEICDDANTDEDCDGVADDLDSYVDPDTQGTWYYDLDGDGYGSDASVVQSCEPAGAPVGGDCNDADASYHPGAPETDCADPNDYNCDGSVGLTDADGDGYAACQDCDDGSATTYPGAVEVCDSADNNCNTMIDEGVTLSWYTDADGDGYGDDSTLNEACTQPPGAVGIGRDCDDGVTGTYPGAPEYCDGIDQDCDGATDNAPVDGSVWYDDLDGDGYGDGTSAQTSCGGAGLVADSTDCNDADSDMYPGALEVCDRLDNDCDGDIDGGAVDATIWYIDSDTDGYGDSAGTMLSCSAPPGYVSYSGDCDDADTSYNPGANESDCADPNDYNCDGSVGLADLDGDGYAACEECDDSEVTVNPGAAETCDGLDNNCNGAIDDGATLFWYADSDGDGYGDGLLSVESCTGPAGYVQDDTDCADADAALNPAAQEVCDGYGDAGAVIDACDQPADYILDDTDCDDTAPTTNPGGTEVCDGVDNDCDGTIDDSPVDIQTWYLDVDLDGFGLDGSVVTACTQPAGYTAAGGDCNDASNSYYPGAPESCSTPVDYNCDGAVGATDADGDGWAACLECDDGNAAIYPGAAESCNGADDDCDGLTDEAGATGETAWYYDGDSDGYGLSTVSQSACTAPAGYVALSTDCNDSRSAVYPGATEVCNGYDDDCDGASDEAGASGETTWYYDADGDGYGGTTTVTACTAPSRYVATGGDCNDSGAAINPNASDVCDTVDNDCDGLVDNDGLCPCTVVNNGSDTYMFCSSGASWSYAGLACTSYGYEMLSINDSAENTFVIDTAWSYANGRWWSGGNDRVLEGRWTWQGGDTWSYSQWHTGAPDTRANNSSDCLEIGSYTDYTWSDQTCNRQSSYVCETP